MGSPVIAIVCSLESFELPGFGALPHYAVYERYLDGLSAVFDMSPVLIPCIGARHRSGAAAFASDCAASIDGLLLPGGSSNISPEWYGGSEMQARGSKDPDRDATVMPLILECLRVGVPILGICRGMQELNVALGGTLNSAVHETPGRNDHRSRRELPFAERYSAAHPLRVTVGSWFERELLAADIGVDDLRVNSLHGQCVERLGRGVVVEAAADDGTIEAIRVEDAASLAFAVQWHPEWHVDMPLHATLLRAFGRACRYRHASRSAGGLSGEG